jgi:hypothetical protein
MSSSFLLSSAFSSEVIGENGIICKNDSSANEGCEYILIAKEEGRDRLKLSESNMNGSTCSSLTFLELKKQSGSVLNFVGHATSSSGFNRTTHSYSLIELNLDTGEGILKFKEGKNPETLLKLYTTSQLSQCKKL